jgi:hypothetical protein
MGQHLVWGAITFISASKKANSQGTRNILAEKTITPLPLILIDFPHEILIETIVDQLPTLIGLEPNAEDAVMR